MNLASIRSILNRVSTLLADFKGKCITSMFVSPENVSDGAPAVPEELSGDFAGGSLAGTLTFTMPLHFVTALRHRGLPRGVCLRGKEEIASELPPTARL